jgi:hypothetical protein
MKKYENPISSKIKYFTKGIKLGEYRSLNLYLKKITIDTDDAIIYERHTTINSYALDFNEIDIINTTPEYVYSFIFFFQ